MPAKRKGWSPSAESIGDEIKVFGAGAAIPINRANASHPIDVSLDGSIEPASWRMLRKYTGAC